MFDGVMTFFQGKDASVGGREGFFRDHEGFGLLYKLTTQSLLDAGLPLEDVETTINNLFRARVDATHACVFQSVLGPSSQQEASLLAQRRVMLFRFHDRLAPITDTVMESFQDDVIAVQNLLGALGFAMPADPRAPSPVRQRTLSATQQDTYTESALQDNTLSLGVNAAAGLPESSPVDIHLRGHIKQTWGERHEQHRSRTNETPYTLSGFEGTTAILQALAVRYHLKTPQNLLTRSEAIELPELTDNAEDLHHLYRSFRHHEVLLAQAAAPFFASLIKENGADHLNLGARSWRKLASAATAGYSAPLLRTLNATLKVPSQWGSHSAQAWEEHCGAEPYSLSGTREREMGYHLAIYSTLYRGAARRIEEGVCAQWRRHAEKRTDYGARPDPSGQIPRTVRLEYRDAISAPPGAMLLTPELISKAFTRPGQNAQENYSVPPFPAFVVPLAEGGVEWVLMPDAVCTAPGVYQNPDHVLDHQLAPYCPKPDSDTVLPRDMAAAQPEPVRVTADPGSTQTRIQQACARLEQKGRAQEGPRLEGETRPEAAP